MRCAALLGIACTLGWSYTHAAETPEALATLVRELGDPRFKVRESAERRLLGMGQDIIPALQQGLRSENLETAERCRKLIPLIGRITFQSRLDAYLNDESGKLSHSLPFLERYRKLAGNDLAARKFYVEMVSLSGDWLEEVEKDPSQRRERYLSKIAQMTGVTNRGVVQGTPSIEIAAVMLVGIDPELVQAKLKGQFDPIFNFYWQANFQTALKNPTDGTFRNLFFGWAESRSDLISTNQVISLLINLNLKDERCIRYAKTVLERKEMNVWMKCQTFAVIGKAGGPADAKVLEPFLKDETVLNNIQWNETKLNTQVRDVALAMTLQLNGKNLGEYGYRVVKEQPQMLWSVNYLGFATPKDREEAFARWAKESTGKK